MLEYPTTCINTSNITCYPPDNHSVDVSLSTLFMLSTYAQSCLVLLMFVGYDDGDNDDGDNDDGDNDDGC